MKRLLFATTNQSKFEEAASELQHAGLEIMSLKDFSGILYAGETGKTFEENAVLKAKSYFAQTKIPCIADDGGLVIDYLNGAPGVDSHRWLGDGATDEERANAVIEKLKGVSQEKRTARLGGFIVFFDGSHILKRENWLHGYIADRLMGEVRKGFPYRPIFMVPAFGKAYSELTDAEHEAVNSRRKNLRELKLEILKLLGL